MEPQFTMAERMQITAVRKFGNNEIVDGIRQMIEKKAKNGEFIIYVCRDDYLGIIDEFSLQSYLRFHGFYTKITEDSLIINWSHKPGEIEASLPEIRNAIADISDEMEGIFRSLENV